MYAHTHTHTHTPARYTHTHTHTHTYTHTHTEQAGGILDVTNPLAHSSGNRTLQQRCANLRPELGAQGVGGRACRRLV